jgi:hypothetical protein
LRKLLNELHALTSCLPELWSQTYHLRLPTLITMPPQSIYHALLRPCVLQILRATGYHSTKPAVLDSLTDLAARYLFLLCAKTATHTAENDFSGEGQPTVMDVRMALQDVGALNPERLFAEQLFLDEEDVRGVEDFVDWFRGPRNKSIMELARGDGGGEAELTDYLNGMIFPHLLRLGSFAWLDDALRGAGSGEWSYDG